MVCFLSWPYGGTLQALFMAMREGR
jgi:hypothetical protein